MKEFIRKNLKIVIAVTVCLIGVAVFICTGELLAKRTPEISTLEVVEVKLSKGQTFDYTGEEIKPEVKYILFKDEDGLEIKKEKKEISSIQYQDNIQVGSADIEVQVAGYQGSVIIEEAFHIRPAKAAGVEVTGVSLATVDLTWQSSAGADGYLVYRSIDGGAFFSPLANVAEQENLTYSDTRIQPNTTYTYYVQAYALENGVVYSGENSDQISQLTPLVTPALSSVTGISHNTVQLQWNIVDGSVGYQVFRSPSKDGEYTCIAEIGDGAVTNYNDATCDCGHEYFYYITACQMINETRTYGDASAVLGGRAIPNKVSVSGSVSQDQTSVTLTWGETPGAQGFEIYRSTSNKSNYQLVQKIDQGNVYSWTDSGLEKDTEYYYRVRAYCVVDGQTIVGNYSNNFYKEVVINYNYAELSGNIAGILQYTSVRYLWGGASPRGWDCSGFTQWALQQCFGVTIPKSAASQAAGGKTISKNDRSQWMPGDILCYLEGGKVGHVALYIGNGKIMHALNEKYGTLIQDVDYYEKWDRATSLYCVKRWY